jgi:hypothetical protein
MATTKIIPEVLDLRGGLPDFSLAATNTVSYLNAGGGNQYNFNGAYGLYGVVNGTYVLSSVSSSHPIAILNNGKTSLISYTGAVNEGSQTGPDGNTYTYYSGDVTITVSGNFDVVSYACKVHGYMGGQNNLIYTNLHSDLGLKIPSGTEINRPATDVAGMIRNNTNETSDGSASCEEYYNGAAWKKINNVVVPAPLLDLSSASLTSTKTLTVVQSQADGLRGYSMVPDGSALYSTTLSSTGDDWLHKYTFSTPFDVTTASSPTSFQTTSTIPNYLTGCLINSDQTKIAYDPYGTNNWYVRNFGTAGDITSLGSSTAYVCSRSGGDQVSNSMIYTDSQTKMFWFTTQMRKTDLSTAGDPGSGLACPTAITNTSYSDFSSDLDGNNCRTLFFNADGTQLTISGDSARLAQYTLSTAYDVTTRGSATKFNFSTLLGGTPELKGLFPNASFTKLILASAYTPASTLYELAL